MLAILKKMLLVSSASPTYIEKESGGRRLSSLKMEKKSVLDMEREMKKPIHHIST